MTGISGDGRTPFPAEGDGHLTSRQLDALRSTYPAWEIHFRVDEPGTTRWTAVLRRPVTAKLWSDGVRERIGSPDAVTLASVLSRQSSLLHNGRADTQPPT
ncbi:hypothetical protein AB0I81_28450 [Nonomuraea sp. NPDC050404]|uniref:hypothetical protein n=1 Tax=Nonomuraea sp. NPDC050404 TaxID=3155783 RepID=UPI0033DBEF3C